MSTLVAQLEHRAKSVAAFVAAAVITYVGDAIANGDALTVRGAVLAAVAAVGTAFTVHQAPRNKDKPKRS